MKKKKKEQNSNGTVVLNKKARFRYSLNEEIEAGIVLQGWEVKSIRAKKMQISESYVVIKKNEMWLLNSTIVPLPTISTHYVPEQTRTRKLLLHKKEIRQLLGKLTLKHAACVPMSVYWKDNKIKCKIAVATGKNQHDKRQTIKNREWERNKQRILKQETR